MPNQHSPPQEMIRALELADGYLHEAQDVLWNTASELPADAERELIEELTEEIWDIQHRLNDLQQEFEQ